MLLIAFSALPYFALYGGGQCKAGPSHHSCCLGSSDVSLLQGLKRAEQNALVELLKSKLVSHSGPSATGPLPELKEEPEKDDTAVQPPTHEQMDTGGSASASSGYKFTKIFSKRTGSKTSTSN